MSGNYNNLYLERSKHILINFSFYYNQNQWGFLITKHIAKIIYFIIEIDKNAEYVICLSKNSGDNILLIVFTNIDASPLIVNHIHEKTLMFFNKYPSSKKRCKYPLSVLFKNFPNNSIQYNLKKHNQSNFNNLNLLFKTSLHKIINELIIINLTKEEFNDEQVFLSNFYLNVLVAKSLQKILGESSIDVLEKIGKIISSQNENKDIWETQLIFDNEFILTDIIAQILLTNTLPTSKRYFCMSKWVDSCEHLFTSQNIFENVNNIFSNWDMITSLVNKQLLWGIEGKQYCLKKFIIDKYLFLLNIKNAK